MTIPPAERSNPTDLGSTQPLHDDGSPAVAGGTPSLDFAETLAGRCLSIDGRINGVVTLRLQIEYPDVAAVIRDADTPARVWGTVELPLDSQETYDIRDGQFRLLQNDDENVDSANMFYDLEIEGRTTGRRLSFRGSKAIHHDTGFDIWRDTTSLPFRVLDGRFVVATGVAHVGPLAVLGIVASMRVRGRGGVRRRLLWKARFLQMFLARLSGTYSFLLSQSADYRSHRNAPRPTRTARLPLPEERWHDGNGWVDSGPDDRMLKLTRYRGGEKGPIVLAPGFSMGASQYTATTTETNLTEFLVEHGYDVWLFDYRASIDLPSSRDRMTLDDIARQDWPRAIDEVRRLTGAEDVQVFAHCIGSMTLLMALLSGTQGVRHAICSQVTVHPVVPALNRFKARIRLADRLEGLGIRTIEHNRDLTPAQRALDLVLFLNPFLRGERCHHPVCRWVYGFYGPTHRHAQLNQETHDLMGELFGVGDLRALNHLGRIVRQGQVVDHEGNDTYLPHVKERMVLPITFLAGERNAFFLPETSRRTLRWLEENNGMGLYRRIVLPEYAHLDAIIGKDAHDEVFPLLLQAIEAHEPAPARL